MSETEYRFGRAQVHGGLTIVPLLRSGRSVHFGSGAWWVAGGQQPVAVVLLSDREFEIVSLESL